MIRIFVSGAVMTNAFSALLICLLICACAAPKEVKIEVPSDSISSSNFVFSDTRAEKAKNDAGRNEGAQYFFGEGQFSPRPQILIERTLRRANDYLQNAKIELKEFSASLTHVPVTTSPMTNTNAMMYGVVGGLVGSLLDATQSPDYGYANAEILIDGASIKASTMGTVSKYDTAGGMIDVMNDMLEKLLKAVMQRSTTTSVNKDAQEASTNQPSQGSAP